jgi:hypothetical protein
VKNPDVLARCLLLALAGPALAAPGNVTVNGAVPPVNMPKGTALRLTLADLDGDGLVDVVASFNNENFWRQLEGGQLTPLDKIPGAGGIVLVADLDGDGAQSLVSLGFAGISAVESVGPFLFGPEEQIATDGTGLSMGLTGDLDGDGHPDILAAQGSGLSTWLDDGLGGLQPAF